MARLLLLELLTVLVARKSITWLSDVKFFAAIVPPMPVLGYAYLQFLVTLALIAWLRIRGARFSDYGFRNCGPLWLFTIITIAAIATSVILPAMLDPLLSNYFGKTPRDLSRFATLVGNLPQFLYVMPLVWIFAAFGEEFLYRGFILENVHRILGGGNAAMVAAIIVQAVLFGTGHAYQGPVGMIPIGVGGIVYGLLYWAGGRRLWPLILGHGVVDTIGFTIMFKGGTP
ncbi:MAG: CPBP family intramembrane metalloprotease [Gammaproteobacteria bacterium]|nr:CPBP family intramembrane metalloprotease [Gammaproteobacteria bacterium]